MKEDSEELLRFGNSSKTSDIELGHRTSDLKFTALMADPGYWIESEIKDPFGKANKSSDGIIDITELIQTKLRSI